MSAVRKPLAEDRSQDKWQVLLESFGDGTWEWHLNSGRLTFSTAWLDRLGFEASDLATIELWRNNVHPDDLAQVNLGVQRVLDNPDLFLDEEFRVCNSAGDWIWMRARARIVTADGADGADGGLHMLGFYEDISARKQTEAALQLAEARWSFALEGAGDGVWDWDLQTGEVFFSRQWKAMLGYDEHEILNDIGEWRRRCIDEDLARSDQEITRLLNGEIEEYRCECRAICKDKSVKWILDRGQIVEWDDAGNPLRMIGTHQDIHLQKTQTERIIQAQQQLARIVDRVPGMVYELVLDRHGKLRFPYASPGIMSIYGHPPEAVRDDASKIVDMILPADRDRVAQSIEYSHQTGTNWRQEYRVQLPDGRIRWVQGDAVQFEHPDFPASTAWCGHIYDISEEKEQFAALQVQQAQIESLTAVLPGYIFEFVMHPDGRAYFPYASAGIEAMFNVSREAARVDAAPLFERVLKPDRARLIDAMQAGARNRTEVREEFRIHDDQVGFRWVLGHAVVIPNPDNPEVARFCGYTVDITSQKNNEQQLDVQARDLALRNQDLEQFAYITSHDLQEPLRKVQSYADRLLRRSGNQLAEPEMRDLSRVIAAATRMRALIDAMLDLARVTFDAADYAALDFRKIIDDMMLSLDLRVSETATDIQLDEVPRVRGNHTLLVQLMQNLVSNAIKFAREGSAPVIQISSNSIDTVIGDPPRIEIRVADNGIGIAPQYADRVFKPLQRLHSREEYAGTGIGLAICRKIVAAHGGEIRLESHQPHGTVFIFDLALA